MGLWGTELMIDVSRYAGRYEHVFETTTAGVTIQSPQLDINTVAAGGGSRLFWKNGLFVVGPESAGAHPGPACYRYPHVISSPISLPLPTVLQFASQSILFLVRSSLLVERGDL